jgi:hypothetical protein
VSKRARHVQDDSFKINKNLLLLLISIVLVIVGFWVAIETSRNCYEIEYQNLKGTQTQIICEGETK